MTTSMKAMHIVGLELRTSNALAVQTIPAHWQRFTAEAVLEQITNKVSDDVYALYTHFENPGVNNEGVYSLIIGAQVRSLGDVPAHLTAATIPAGQFKVFAVQAGHPEKVYAKWQEIWGMTQLPRVFMADYERYTSAGQIDILVGVR
jgi:predicted transcriptional regulator YdeE